MSIKDKLNYLAATKISIKNAIVNKGVEVEIGDTFRSYAAKIASISGGKEYPEYQYAMRQVEAVWPKTPMTVDSPNYGWNVDNFVGSTADLAAYKNVYKTYIYKLFDDDNTTDSTEINYEGAYFKLKSAPRLLSIDIKSSGDLTWTVYGSNVFSTNSANWMMVTSLKPSAFGQYIWSNIPVDASYEYYWVTSSSAGYSVYEMRFNVLEGGASCYQLAGNIAPMFTPSLGNYMDVIFPPIYVKESFYNQSTYQLKPFDSGGCIYGWVDDGTKRRLSIYFLSNEDGFRYCLAVDAGTPPGYEQVKVGEIWLPEHIYWNGSDWVMPDD